MDLENEPIEKSKEVVKEIFQRLVKNNDLIPKNWKESNVYLIGIAIWDIFSNNHEVISSNNKVYDIGSWRGSGRTISEIINNNFKENESYGYLDFYMGSFCQIESEINLKEIYKEIFKFLKSFGCDWYYSHSRIYMVDFRDTKEEKSQDNLFYDSNKAVEVELEEKKENENLKELQDLLDEDFEKRLKKSREQPLPEIIVAFKDVYGYLPKGSPF